MVGAWCFLDHGAPSDAQAGVGSIGPHPHIGLQTFTWVIQGEILHRDSLGTEQLIRPMQVNLMTAGQGIAHAEEVQPAAGAVQLVQLWIALPETERHGPPQFQHCPSLPRVELGGFVATVLAGKAFGLDAPAKVFSPLVGVDLRAAGAAQATLVLDPRFEYAIISLEGSIAADGEALTTDEMLFLDVGRTTVELGSQGPAHALLIGGEPFGESILMWWNFVGRTPEELRQATEDWNAVRRFGEIATKLARIEAPDISGLRLRLR
jgi:redox-sensitive bicupin YhaK (pirin superfamily)